MCDRLATTQEHVPPKAFFPKQKDLDPGMDYRQNLITVPACNEHNLATSTDDEYVSIVVALHWKNNEAGYNYITPKTKRALRRSGGLLARIAEGNAPTTVEGLPSRAIQVDIEGFQIVLDKVARGIHYYHFGQKWLEPIDILLPGLVGVDSAAVRKNTKDRMIAQLARHVFNNRPQYGENPDVFYYQAQQDETIPFTTVRMVFYDGFEVLAVTRLDEQRQAKILS